MTSKASAGELPEALGRTVSLLGRSRTPYALIGALVLPIWGRPRATYDVDILVLLDEEDLARLATRLERHGMKIDQEWLDWNPLLRGTMVRLSFGRVSVDLLRPRDLHDQAVFRRRRRKRIEGRSCWLVAPEDFVLQKLKLGRPQDFQDALSVFDRQGRSLDRRHLRRWARRLGLLAELSYLEGLV